MANSFLKALRAGDKEKKRLLPLLKILYLHFVVWRDEKRVTQLSLIKAGATSDWIALQGCSCAAYYANRGKKIVLKALIEANK